MKSKIDAWAATLYNPRTAAVYRPHVERFLKRIGSRSIKHLTADDIEGYILSLPTWGTRHLGLAAIKNYLVYLDARIPARKIRLGAKPDDPPIDELSEEEWNRLEIVVAHEDLENRVAYGLLKETGHRRRAVTELPKTAVVIRDGLPEVHWPADIEKVNSKFVSPISPRLYSMCQDLAASHPGTFLLPMKGWTIRKEWLNWRVEKWRSRAQINKDLTPHSFRHFISLKSRRAHKERDAVINSIGWRTSQQYDRRYGKRQAYETANEMRDVATGQKPVTVRAGDLEIFDLRHAPRPTPKDLK